MAEVSFPLANYGEAMEHLRRPFAAGAIKWKVQQHLRNDRGLLVAYVDARLVQDRLDIVCGPAWSSTLREFGDKGDVLCELTVFDVTRSDVGKGGFGKASASDAFKRAGVHHGVGRSLYAIPARTLESSESGGDTDSNDRPKLKRVLNRKNETQLYITDAARGWLAQSYQRWLEQEGTGRFGDPFDHGNAADSIGDAAVEGIDEEPDSPKFEQEKNELWELYEETTKGKTALRRKLPPGRFKAQIEGAANGDLDELRQRVEALSE